MGTPDHEKAIRACYAGWARSYLEDYYGPRAPYPPVHRDLVRKLILEAGARTVLDAGCGPGAFLRTLAADGLELHGFDLTPEMVAEARSALGAHGVPAARIWEGSVADESAYRPPRTRRKRRFDATVCVGVLPHVAERDERAVLENLRSSVRKGGLVVLEARNALFSLFTLNRYSFRFLRDELIREERLKARLSPRKARELGRLLDGLGKHFRLDLPPVRKGKAGEPGYDQILSRTHNPLVLREAFAAAGFRDVRVLFYHFHCLPPLLEQALPRTFRAESLTLEAEPEDWRGHFLASAFLLVGKGR